MSDLALSAIAVALLIIIGLAFWYAWHGDGKPNGLKNEMEERVTALENENVTVWKELKRLANRWVP